MVLATRVARLMAFVGARCSRPAIEWLVVALFALGLVAVGVSPAVAQPARSGLDRAGLASSIRWRSCGVRLDCARVRVPLDWARPAGRRSRWR